MNKIINSKYTLIIPLFIIMIISLLNMQNARLLSALYEHNLINCPRKEAYNPIDILNILYNDGLIDRKKKYKIIKAYRLIKSLY